MPGQQREGRRVAGHRCTKDAAEERAGLKPGPYKSLEEDYRFAPKASRRPSNVKSRRVARKRKAVASDEWRVTRKRKAVASENEGPDRNDPTFVPCI